MYKTLGISLFLIVVSFSSWAQKPTDPALIPKFDRATKLYFDADRSRTSGGILGKTRAIDLAKESADLFREIRANEEAVYAASLVGRICLDLDANQKAFEFITYALESKTKIGFKNQKFEALLLNNLALANFHLGNRQKALELYEQSLVIHRELGDKSNEAISLDNIGGLYREIGEPQKALEFYTAALTLSRELKDMWREAINLTNIGTIYVRLGDDQKAFETFTEALTKDRPVETVDGMGDIYLRRQEFAKAVEMYIDVQATYILSGNRRGMQVAGKKIGMVHEASGNLEKALEQYEMALPVFRELGDRINEAETLRGIGQVNRLKSDTAKAREFYLQALPIFTSIGDLSGEAQTLGYLQYVFDGHLSVFYGKQAVNTYQNLRQKIQGLNKEDQKSYLRLIEGTYRKLAGTLIELGRYGEALQVLNAFKDQQYFDFEASKSKKPTSLSLTAKETAIASLLTQASVELGSAGALLAAHDRKAGQLAPSSAEKLQRARLASDVRSSTIGFQNAAKVAASTFAQTSPTPDRVADVPDLIQLQRALGDLNRQTGQKTVAVYQLVGENIFSSLIVTPESIDKVTVTVKGSVLNEKAKKLWNLFRSDKFDTTPLSREIYNTVAAQVLAKMPGDATTIMWSLDGNLRYIPMAALFDGEKFLVERYNNVTFTRPDHERMTRAVSRTWKGSGFGTSLASRVRIANEDVSFAPLPGVVSELDSIFKSKSGDSGIVDGAVLPDRAFTKKSFIAAVRSGRPLAHVASHFYFRPGDESRSFLLLGDSTAFSLDEMKREGDLFKGIELLTLSACETAAAQSDANGREIDGFAELAQRLGAGAVMATLWPVSDNSTPRLMQDFYQGKVVGNLTKAEALRKAQVGMLRGRGTTPALSATRTRNGVRAELYAPTGDGPKYKIDPAHPFAHPFYWAPFVLIGNWK